MILDRFFERLVKRTPKSASKRKPGSFSITAEMQGFNKFNDIVKLAPITWFQGVKSGLEKDKYFRAEPKYIHGILNDIL